MSNPVHMSEAMAVFTGCCETCESEHSFREYEEADSWWREHADEGHIVEIVSDMPVRT